MPIYVTTEARQNGSIQFDIAFTDADGEAVTPTSASWSLFDIDGNVINGRSDETITPATTATVVLSGDDLAITEDYDRVPRYLVVNYTYSGGTPAVDDYEFVVRKVKGE
jgi:hypothetical protein